MTSTVEMSPDTRGIDSRGTEGKEIKLHSFAESPPPPALMDGWRRMLDFPKQTRDAFWTFITSVPSDPVDPRTRGLLEDFCQRYELREEDLMPAVHAAGLLLRQASALDLDRTHLHRDLVALSNGTDDFETVLAKYDTLKRDLRQRMVGEALIDHGKVLVGIDWRVDTVVSSDRGANLNATVMLLTLRYRDGDRVERITLQLTPDAMKELKTFTERIG